MYCIVISHNMSVQTSLYKHPKKKVKLKISNIILVLLKWSVLAHPFSCMFQNSGALFQLGMKGHLQCLNCLWNMNSLNCDGCWSCMAGIACQNAATIVPLHFVGLQWHLEATARVWGSYSCNKGSTWPSVTQNRSTGLDTGKPSDTRTLVVAWQKWDLLCFG